jgi:hypothetical protein
LRGETRPGPDAPPESPHAKGIGTTRPGGRGCFEKRGHSRLVRPPPRDDGRETPLNTRRPPRLAAAGQIAVATCHGADMEGLRAPRPMPCKRGALAGVVGMPRTPPAGPRPAGPTARVSGRPARDWHRLARSAGVVSKARTLAGLSAPLSRTSRKRERASLPPSHNAGMCSRTWPWGDITPFARASKRCILILELPVGRAESPSFFSRQRGCRRPAKQSENCSTLIYV